MKIGILIGSIRKQRVSDRLGKWVNNELENFDNVSTTVIDLKDFNLPFFDEIMPPQYNQNREINPEVKKFLNTLSDLDGLVVITPEYNRSYSSVLKNAIDFIAFELQKKPVMLVAHGSTGGAQAVAHLRGVFPGIQAVTVPSALMIPARVGEVFDENGQIIDIKNSQYAGFQESLKNILSDLIWYSKALATSRES